VIPFRVTAHMGAGVAYTPGDGLSLDGPLLYAVVLERRGHDYFARPDPDDIVATDTAHPDPAMPLAVHGDPAAGRWCYRVSGATIDGPHGEELLHWHKRFDEALAGWLDDEAAIDDRRRRVPSNTGEFMAYRMPIYLQLAERIHWYAVGHPAETLRLLETHVRHIGKKHSSGHGLVVGWEVEGIPEDRSLWGPDGAPTRTIPIELAGDAADWGAETAWTGFRPPYWLPANQALCVVPAMPQPPNLTPQTTPTPAAAPP